MNNALPVLRPMSMGELLDQAIRLYRKNFFAFMGIIALVYIPISLITLVSTLIAGSAVSQTGLNQGAQGNPFLNPAYLSGLGGTLLSILLSAVFVRCLGTAALTRAIADNYLGKQVGILASYKSVGKSWLKLLGAVVLAGLIYVGVILFLIIPCIGWFTAPGLAVFLISVTLPMIAPVIVIEKTGASASLRRAWDLSRRRFWWLLGYVLILGLLSLVIVTGPAYLIRYLVSLIGGNTGNFVTQLQLQTITQQVVMIVTGVLYMPLQLTAITLAYFDLRVRTEGFDLALLSLAATSGSGIEATAEVPVMHERKSLITWPDIGHFALLSIAFIALYAIFIAIAAAIGMALLPAAGL